jgi:putative transposase
MALAELVQKAGEGDFLRAVAEAVRQILMAADVEGLVGAPRHERSPDRLNYRNGRPQLGRAPGAGSCSRPYVRPLS